MFPPGGALSWVGYTVGIQYSRYKDMGILMQDLASKHSTRPGILFISTLIIIACALELRVLEAQDCGSVGSTLSLLEQADVDGFQADHGPCDRVLGSLQVEPFNGPITDLNPLADLTEVGEFLTVEGTFSDLMGLHNLTTVGKSFRIEGDATPLTDLTGLDSLASADVFHLSSLYSLTGNKASISIAKNYLMHCIPIMTAARSPASSNQSVWTEFARE